MTTFDTIRAREYVLVNAHDEDVVSIGLGGNNDKPQRIGRLQVQWRKDYAAEIEIEPGPECQGSPGNNIIAQVMMWAPRTADGTGRQRLTMTIAQESNGECYGIIDSTTNDPSGSEGQRRSMPLMINAGEAKGIYVGLYPSIGTVRVRNTEADSGHVPVTDLIAKLTG